MYKLEKIGPGRRRAGKRLKSVPVGVVLYLSSPKAPSGAQRGFILAAQNQSVTVKFDHG